MKNQNTYLVDDRIGRWLHDHVSTGYLILLTEFHVTKKFDDYQI